MNCFSIRQNSHHYQKSIRVFIWYRGLQYSNLWRANLQSAKSLWGGEGKAYKIMLTKVVSDRFLHLPLRGDQLQVMALNFPVCRLEKR